MNARGLKLVSTISIGGSEADIPLSAISSRLCINGRGTSQAFNSLDAQREACAAFIQSQKIEGWSLVSTLYDDGGFSGGSMERPALARFLNDAREGRVDVVVVYKVDRLTRSLNDFARIVDVFDATGASFVSVTQQFNTTSSMGRLTLNVLLSFAQFEREVIAERVRDKIAQSKAKGMWMGGSVPIGYDVIDKKLIPNCQEAKTVQHIYRRYLELPSVQALMDELKAQNIVTKRHGTDRGGQTFARGPLYHLLSNPIYIGKVPHRGQIHDGAHEAIIDQTLWDAVQAKREATIGAKRALGNSRHGSLLTGMIRDHVDRPMSPSHAVKQQRRYRYYVSSMAAVTHGSAAKALALRLSAPDLEQAVIDAMTDLLGDQRIILALPQVDARALMHRRKAAELLASTLGKNSKAEVRQQLQSLGTSITVHPDRIDASISQRLLVAALDGTGPSLDDDGVRLPLVIPTKPDRRGHNLRLVLRAEKERPPRIDRELIALLQKAEATRQKLFSPADPTQRPDREVERLARLAFLAPDIVSAILEGRQPSSLTPRHLLKYASVPFDWKRQRQALGF